jgi:hypothetical protein
MYCEFVKQQFQKKPAHIRSADYMKQIALKWNRQKKNKKKSGSGYAQDYSVPTIPLGVRLQFSSTEHSHLQDVYLSIHNVIRSDLPFDNPEKKQVAYKLVTVQFYYPDNFNTGLPLTPVIPLTPSVVDLYTPPPLGDYHKHDVEYVMIYYRLDSPTIPVAVFFSCHHLNEGNWCAWKDCIIRDNYLTIFVAKDSHANYPQPGVKKRARGLANDLCEDNSRYMQIIPWGKMITPHKDIDYKSCKIYVGLRPSPPAVTLTHDQRWNITG